MLRTLFRRSGAKYERSQFGREMNDFCLWLQQTGYCRANIRGHLHRLFKVLTRSRKLEPDDTRSSVVLHRVFGRYCTSVERSKDFRGTERAYCRFLRSRRQLREDSRPADAVSLLLDRYRRYLDEVRGFAEITVTPSRDIFVTDWGYRRA